MKDRPKCSFEEIQNKLDERYERARQRDAALHRKIGREESGNIRELTERVVYLEDARELVNELRAKVDQQDTLNRVLLHHIHAGQEWVRELVKTIQVLHTRIETLRAQVEAMERRQDPKAWNH